MFEYLNPSKDLPLVTERFFPKGSACSDMCLSAIYAGNLGSCNLPRDYI